MKSRLIELERVIESERHSFYKIGKALKEIRDDRLYRDLLFNSFEAYLRKRWELSRSHAYRLIEAYRVIDNLSSIGDVLPENEAQLRPLGHLAPHDQRRIWKDFLAAGMELSARNIKRFVSKHVSRKKARIDLTGVISPGYEQAVLSLMEQIRLAGQDGWRSTSREAGLFWLRVMRDKILAKV
jgi:hypothetical protein